MSERAIKRAKRLQKRLVPSLRRTWTKAERKRVGQLMASLEAKR